MSFLTELGHKGFSAPFELALDSVVDQHGKGLRLESYPFSLRDPEIECETQSLADWPPEIRSGAEGVRFLGQKAWCYALRNGFVHVGQRHSDEWIAPREFDASTRLELRHKRIVTDRQKYVRLQVSIARRSPAARPSSSSDRLRRAGRKNAYVGQFVRRLNEGLTCARLKDEVEVLTDWLIRQEHRPIPNSKTIADEVRADHRAWRTRTLKPRKAKKRPTTR